MANDPFTYEQREGEAARREERNESYERYCPPAVVEPLTETLKDRMLERFATEPKYGLSGGVLVTDRQTNDSERFVNSFEGGRAAACWMVERMQA